jgi:hypothetical protein
MHHVLLNFAARTNCLDRECGSVSSVLESNAEQPPSSGFIKQLTMHSMEPATWIDKVNNEAVPTASSAGCPEDVSAPMVSEKEPMNQEPTNQQPMNQETMNQEGEVILDHGNEHTPCDVDGLKEDQQPLPPIHERPVADFIPLRVDQPNTLLAALQEHANTSPHTPQRPPLVGPTTRRPPGIRITGIAPEFADSLCRLLVLDELVATPSPQRAFIPEVPWAPQSPESPTQSKIPVLPVSMTRLQYLAESRVSTPSPTGGRKPERVAISSHISVDCPTEGPSFGMADDTYGFPNPSNNSLPVQQRVLGRAGGSLDLGKAGISGNSDVDTVRASEVKPRPSRCNAITFSGKVEGNLRKAAAIWNDTTKSVSQRGSVANLLLSPKKTMVSAQRLAAAKRKGSLNPAAPTNDETARASSASLTHHLRVSHDAIRGKSKIPVLGRIQSGSLHNFAHPSSTSMYRFPASASLAHFPQPNCPSPSIDKASSSRARQDSWKGHRHTASIPEGPKVTETCFPKSLVPPGPGEIGTSHAPGILADMPCNYQRDIPGRSLTKGSSEKWKK